MYEGTNLRYDIFLGVQELKEMHHDGFYHDVEWTLGSGMGDNGLG